MDLAPTARPTEYKPGRNQNLALVASEVLVSLEYAFASKSQRLDMMYDNICNAKGSKDGSDKITFFCDQGFLLGGMSVASHRI